MFNYINGNCKVTLLEDGTKIREFEDDPKPIFPESIDLKITNYCDAGCRFCHEMSTKSGDHGSLNKVLELLRQLPSGVEIAIGGGNPISHPEFENFIISLSGIGLVPNVTINEFHINRVPIPIRESFTWKYIGGIGISWCKGNFPIGWLLQRGVIVHLIAGVHKVELLEALQSYKVLVLGYKQFGFGRKFYSKEVEDNLKQWQWYIHKYINKQHLSFDNLAIEQLDIFRFLSNNEQSSLYMGNDGQFTMYIDAVKGEFSKSSTSQKRYKLGEFSDIKDIFRVIRSE